MPLRILSDVLMILVPKYVIDVYIYEETMIELLVKTNHFNITDFQQFFDFF